MSSKIQPDGRSANGDSRMHHDSPHRSSRHRSHSRESRRSHRSSRHDEDDEARRERRRRREEEDDEARRERHKRRREERERERSRSRESRSSRRHRDDDERHESRRHRDGYDYDRRRSRYDDDRSSRYDDRRSSRGHDDEKCYDRERESYRPPRRDDYERRPRGSPSYAPRPPTPPPAEAAPEDDTESEQRTVFVSQLSARTSQRDLGKFFDDNLGDGSVRDARIVMDRGSKRSKGIGYVELASLDLLPKALALSGQKLMGLPVLVMQSEADRNRQPPAATAQVASMASDPANFKLYVGSLHFNLTQDDVKAVFEPFGELEYVQLHTDEITGKSKGYAFVQYKRLEDARMALDQMNNFNLAGRQIRVSLVNNHGMNVRLPEANIDDAGPNLNAMSRHQLMQNLARSHDPRAVPAPNESLMMMRPNIPQTMATKSILLKNMFDPSEETERDWDLDLAEDVKGEVEHKYGKVINIAVEKESQGEIAVQFDTIEAAQKAIQGLNGRWFGGRQVSAAHLSDTFMEARLRK